MKGFPIKFSGSYVIRATIGRKKKDEGKSQEDEYKPRIVMKHYFVENTAPDQIPDLVNKKSYTLDVVNEKLKLHGLDNHTYPLKDAFER